MFCRLLVSTSDKQSTATWIWACRQEWADDMIVKLTVTAINAKFQEACSALTGIAFGSQNYACGAAIYHL